MFPRLNLVEFSYVDDSGKYLESASLDSARELEYGCGLFRFQKTDAEL
jgi:hypothetical protein